MRRCYVDRYAVLDRERESHCKVPHRTLYILCLQRNHMDLLELLKVAEKHNENWYPFLYGYMKEELPNLELDDSDADLGEQKLFMGNYDTCVVGENFGFTNKYAHNGLDNCFVCARLADKLANFSDSYASDRDREQFVITLSNFYKHMGYMK